MTPTHPLAAINFHVFKPCSARCRFCFATFPGVRGQLSTADASRLMRVLRDAGARKLNFAGGEPTLHPDIGGLVARASALGFTTCIVTNGARLSELLDAAADQLDWVGLSVDSAIDSVQTALGRGLGGHVARAVELAGRCHGLGVGLKLNSVVTALNWEEDLSRLVRTVRPARWKVFQVLPVAGENDGSVEDLLIDASQFAAFVDRHRHLAAEGLGPIAEDNQAMTASYVMIDPLGRFFDNATGRLRYSEPILDVGVERALAQVTFDAERFVARGGRWAW